MLFQQINIFSRKDIRTMRFKNLKKKSAIRLENLFKIWQNRIHGPLISVWKTLLNANAADQKLSLGRRGSKRY